MGLVDFVEALEVVLVRLGEGNNQQGCSDAHLGTGILKLAAHHLGCNKSKGSSHIGFLGKLWILSQPVGGLPILKNNKNKNKIFKTKFALELPINVMKYEEKNVLKTFG